MKEPETKIIQNVSKIKDSYKKNTILPVYWEEFIKLSTLWISLD